MLQPNDGRLVVMLKGEGDQDFQEGVNGILIDTKTEKGGMHGKII